MDRKTFLLLLAVAWMAPLIMGAGAQPVFPALESALQEMSKSISSMAGSLQQVSDEQRRISKQLDQILAGQENMARELEVVKVRASLKP